MKKILYTFIVCIVAIIIAIIVSNFMSKGMEFDSSFIFGKSEKMIDDTFKVNELQRKKSYYFYNLLTDDEKKIYSVIARGVKNLDNKMKISLDNVTNEEFSNMATRVIDAFFADHPEVFYLEHKYETGVQKGILNKKFYISVTYNVKNTQELNQKINEMKATIDSIIEKVNATNIYEKEIIIHDEFCNIIKYDYDKSVVTETHTSYGALANKLAVCDGVAKGMQLLLDRIDVETVFVTGSIKEGPHAWIMANLEDNWYNVDVTSDMSVKNGETIIHSYFNLDTASMKVTHYFENQSLLPNAVKTDKTYYDIANLKLANDNTFDKDFQNILQNSRNKKIIEFKPVGIKRLEKRFTAILSNDSVFTSNSKDGKIYFYKILDTYIIENK